MTGGSRIRAIDAAGPEGVGEEQTNPAAEPLPVAEEPWEDEEAPVPAPRRWPALLALVLTLAVGAGWTALFVMANLTAMQAGGNLAQWTAWIRDWSVPPLLLALVWLLAMRNSRREALRFGEAARVLGEESSRLEARLSTVNRELSLAREFLAAQGRDIDALGRVAGERLSEHADRLAGLVTDNGARIEAIGTVSEAALDNMEKLRFQLPVIASSAKDVTNNIATAGRTAHSQIEEMVQGFNKLNQFGQASERQVQVLRELVEKTLAEFTQQAEQLEAITSQRFAALTQGGEEFRTRLDAQEIEALAAIRTRAKALGDELGEARKLLDENEAESLTSLRARLTAVRDESGAIARSLREAEGQALDAWRRAVASLEEDLRQAVSRVGEIDEQAMVSARRRIAALTEEAEEIDARMAERDRVFAEEIERRRAEFETRHAAFGERLEAQMAAQREQAEAFRAHSETIGAQLGDYASRMNEIAAHGGEAEGAIGASLTVLAEKLTASREALSGTDKAIAGLTDDSVRLLELIRASVTHSEEDLPAALAAGETRLAQFDERVQALGAAARNAVTLGESLLDHVAASKSGLAEGIEHARELGHALSDKTSAIEALQSSLRHLSEQSAALAEQARNDLASAVTDLAERIGEESGAAIDRAVRAKAAEISGQLEEAASNAAGVSRDAAVQLRDQLAKVNDLAGNLERRVAHARARAEEQVDNDFARRVALITESLNSNAIDIARAMDTEVTDTAWASYLRGDRGIFTRRAVRLLENPEARAVSNLYENDREFRDHVSRYIHDFEAMLRQLLSTRDGHALGVTLLSSDMGKLYVALAQAIERLRG
jgi:chromosome segregation ATPase